MRKWLYLVLVLACLALPVHANAQAAPAKFSALEVDLWPEYDKPSMLVIYRITLSPGASLPADLTVNIPASAGNPSAVAARQVDGTLVNIVYDQQAASGGWSALKFTATTPEVQIEYYDPGLTKKGAARHFEYNWPGGNDVDSFAIQVQEPLGASSMSITPSLGVPQAGKDGLNYFTAQVGSLKAGQAFKITIDYQKSNDTLSSEKLDVKPSAPISDNAPFYIHLVGYLPWIMGALGVALIVGGAWWYWRTGNIRPGQKSSRRKARIEKDEEIEPDTGVAYYDDQTVAREKEVTGPGGAVYCHQCGRRAAPGDRFCRSCGATLRTE